ncbi:HNH endonuclease family protein [Pseudidiomarina sp.]|uniref:HNH endonuclease family protein n=1 Tax=Pseudidiomarina sp. TaxID=2081707 RepID=UPI003A97AA90
MEESDRNSNKEQSYDSTSEPFLRVKNEFAFNSLCIIYVTHLVIHNFTSLLKFTLLTTKRITNNSILRHLFTLTITAPFILLECTLNSSLGYAGITKLSSSGVCHPPSSPYYERTQKFTSYASLALCLEAGGRLPKTMRNASQPLQQNRKEYSRNAFAHWSDEDNDCLNTRHELLQQLSTARVTMSSDGCRVVRGRWNDPYSGKVFLDATEMDIDHLVPLAWAWENGAYDWSESARRSFANDPINLFAVHLTLNRSKGGKGPDQWLPPNADFHCQYISRYLRVVISYDFSTDTRDQIRRLQANLC